MPFELPVDYVTGMAGWLFGLAFLLVLLLVVRRRSAAAGRPRTTRANVGLSIWVFLATLTLVELYFAIIYDRTDSFNMTNVSQHWLARHVFPTQRSLPFSAGQRLPYTVYRDEREFPRSRKPGKHYVCFIGDSFTVGHGIVRPSDRFSDRVQASIERQRPGHVVVSNLAAEGRDLPWVETLLQQLLYDGYTLQTVVYVICLNDIESFDDSLEESSGDFGQQPDFFLLRHTYFLNLLYFRIRMQQMPLVRNYFSSLSQSYEGAAWDKMRDKIDDIRRLCVDNRLDLRIAVFPFVHNLGPAYPFRDAHRRIVEYCHDARVPVVDLLAVLESHADEKLTVNPFDAHPNERAHALAAEAIERELLGDLFEDPADAAAERR